MMYFNLNELIKREKQCRYSLVIAVAKEARNVAAKAELSEMKLEEPPIHVAIDSMLSGKVQYREPVENAEN